MEVNLVEEGLKFMVLGMSVVFAFLVFLVFVLKLQAKIVMKFFPQAAPACEVSPKASAGGDNQVVAAIMAAIKKYRDD